jgi:hypothetical protein
MLSSEKSAAGLEALLTRRAALVSATHGTGKTSIFEPWSPGHAGQNSGDSTDEGNYRAAIKMVKMQGGVFGSVSSSREVIQALRPLARA